MNKIINSGSEANDLAVFLAKLSTGNQHFIALRNSYHGYVGNAYHITSMQTWKHDLTPMPGLERTIAPNVYRGAFQGPDAADRYADDVKSVIELNTSGRVAGFIAEPIQGAGGFVPLPYGYLKKAYEHVRNAGGVVICDEVQTGFGRLGKSYWGCVDHGVSPDIITMAKGVGNGTPLAVVATKKHIADKISGKLYFNTFGGNPLALAAGREVLNIIDDEKLPENAEKIGNLLLQRLKGIQNKYEKVGDIRGKGLMIGVEFVKNRQTKEPSPSTLNNIVEQGRNYGILFAKGGYYGNVLRVSPMLNCTEADANFAMDVLDRTLEEEQAGKLTFF